MNLRVLNAHPSDLEDALAGELAALRAQDPLAPISVVVGGTLLRPHLRRRLAELNGSHINVHLLTAAELGLRLAEPRLIAAGRRPLSAVADRALVHEIAREADGYFEPVRETPGFAEVLGRLFRELRGALVSSAALTAVVGKGDHPKHVGLATLYARYREARTQFYDGEDCLAEVAEGDGMDMATLVYGVWQMAPSLRRALEQLAARTPVTVLLPQTGTPADQVHADLRSWLDSHGAEILERPRAEAQPTALTHLQERIFANGAPVEPDGSVRLLSAPDPSREAREAVRACIEWAREGIPLHEMAIACRNPDAYRQSVESACREAEVPVYVHSGTHITERPLGRQALALLELIDSDMPRAALMELLIELRLPDETWERLGGILPARWDSISRKAGVIRGLEQWRERLTLHIAGQREYESSSNGEGESRADTAASLLAFIEELAERFAARQEVASWAEHAEYAGALLSEYVKGSEQIVLALDGLRELDAMGGPVSFERFRDAAAAIIEGLRVEDATGQRPAAFERRGLNFIDVNSLRHLRFGAVAVLGLTERAFPPPARQDPLLLDAERVTLSQEHGMELPLRSHGADPEPLQFTLAIGAARERLLLSFARAEESGGRAKLPSSFFRAAAEALTGERVTAQDVDLIDPGLFERAGAGRIGAGALGRAFSAEDYDRTLLEEDKRAGGRVGAAALSDALPSFARARALVLARRRTKTLTPFDGLLESDEARGLLSAHWGEGAASLSPTGLERYATCPYHFFLSNVLNVKSVEEPEEVERISAADRGSLIHAVLCTFMEGLRPKRPSRSSATSQMKRLMAVAHAECEAYERQGLTGHPLLWHHDREEILEDIAAWYLAELDDEDSALFDDADFEVRFGPAHHGELTGRLSRDEPVVIDLDGAKASLSGRVDRLEWSGGKRFRVIDYKTGSSRKRPGDNMVEGGRSLQLPLYMIAASELLSIPAENGSAQYFYNSRRGRLRRSTFDGAALKEGRKGLGELLGELIGGIRGGDFHSEPSSDACRYCDFSGTCDAAREPNRDNKIEDPLVARFKLRPEVHP